MKGQMNLVLGGAVVAAAIGAFVAAGQPPPIPKKDPPRPTETPAAQTSTASVPTAANSGTAPPTDDRPTPTTFADCVARRAATEMQFSVLIEQMVGVIENDMPEKAGTALLDALAAEAERMPTNAEEGIRTRVFVAELLVDRQQAKRAEALLNPTLEPIKALKAAPGSNFDAVRGAVVSLLARLGRHDEAEALAGKLPAVMADLAAAYGIAGDQKRARALLEKLAEVDAAEGARQAYRRVRILSALGDHAAARELASSMESKGEQALAHYRRAESAVDRNDQAEVKAALKDLLEALKDAKTTGQRETALLLRAVDLYLAAGDMDDARDVVERAREAADKETDEVMKNSALAQVATAYGRVGDFEKGMAVLDTLAGDRLVSPMVLPIAKGDLLARKGEWREAVQLASSLPTWSGFPLTRLYGIAATAAGDEPMDEAVGELLRKAACGEELPNSGDDSGDSGGAADNAAGGAPKAAGGAGPQSGPNKPTTGP